MPVPKSLRVFAGRLPVSHASRSSGEFIKPDGKTKEREKGRAAPEHIVGQAALHGASPKGSGREISAENRA